MRKIFLLSLLFLTHNVFAAQCNIDIDNEVHLDGKQVKIYQQGESKVLIDANNDLYIEGKKIDLDQMQRDALDAYRQSMNEYLPRAKDLANQGVGMANELLDNLGQHLDDSQAFDNVKKAIGDFVGSMESRYYKKDEMVVPKGAFKEFRANWQQDFAKARENFDMQFFSSAFDVMKQKMQKEGSFDFTAMTKQMQDMKTSLFNEANKKSGTLKKEAKTYCDDLDSVAEQEQKLHKTIPELKDYQVFTI